MLHLYIQCTFILDFYLRRLMAHLYLVVSFVGKKQDTFTLCRILNPSRKCDGIFLVASTNTSTREKIPIKIITVYFLIYSTFKNYIFN